MEEKDDSVPVPGRFRQLIERFTIQSFTRRRKYSDSDFCDERNYVDSVKFSTEKCDYSESNARNESEAARHKLQKHRSSDEYNSIDGSDDLFPEEMVEEVLPANILCQCWQQSPAKLKLELFKACYIGRLDIVKRIILVDCISPDSYCTFEEHAHMTGCPDDESERFSAKKMHPGPGWPALCAAAAKGHSNIVDFLLNVGATPDITTVESETRSSVRYFPLYLACARGYKEIVKILLRYRSMYNINQMQQQGYNVVIGACMMGNSDPEILKLVIEAGANVNHLDPKGGSAMFLCAQHGRPEFMRILFEHGAFSEPKPSVGQFEFKRRNSAPIHIATSRNNVEAIQVLGENGANINACIGSSGATALSLAAQSGFYESAKCLLQFNADVNASDIEGKTPLHKACESQSITIIELLLEHNAFVDAVDIEGCTPLFIAIRVGSLCITNALLSAGADLSISSLRGFSIFDTLFSCIMHGMNGETAIQLCSLLIQYRADVNGLKSMFKPLHFACKIGDPLICSSILKFLLCNGANVSQTDSNGQIALHSAASEGNYSAVAILLNAGSSVNHMDHFGMTPLLACCSSTISNSSDSLKKVAKILVSRGADINYQSPDGLSAVAAAIAYQHPHLVSYLISLTDCDLSTVILSHGFFSAMLPSSSSAELIQTAIEIGMNQRSLTYYLAAIHPRFGVHSLLRTKLMSSPLFDPCLNRDVISFFESSQDAERNLTNLLLEATQSEAEELEFP